MPKRWRSLMGFLVGGLAIVGVSYTILATAENAIISALDKRLLLANNRLPVQIDYGTIDISFTSRSFMLEEVRVVLDSFANSQEGYQPHCTVGKITASNFKLAPLLFRKDLVVNELKIEELVLIVNDEENSFKKKAEEKKASNKRVGKIAFDNIILEDYLLAKLGAKRHDTINALRGQQLVFSGVVLESEKENSPMRLGASDLKISGLNHQGILGDERISAGEFMLDLGKGTATVTQLQYGDSLTARELVKKQAYSTPINSLHVPQLDAHGFQIDSLLLKGKICADSLQLNSPSISILKDTRKPWNKTKNILLPQETLRKNHQKIALQKVGIKNGRLSYVELLETKEMYIPIDQLELQIFNIGWSTTHEESAQIATTIDLKGRLFKDFGIGAHFTFPDPYNSDEFKFEGFTEAFAFETFNPIMVPTSNIKFESGNVRSINFNGTGNSKSTSGEFVMVYNDLKTVVLKKNAGKANKTFSWLANSAVRKENPKRGTLKVAEMGYSRVPYKGFGNYIFKTVESGLINSVYPFGKRTKYQ